jgi:ribosomal protein S18 acetylase RimI-like enzyme
MAEPSYTIQPAGLRDLNDLRRLEKECFEQDAWPLWDLIGVLSMPGLVRLKASTAAGMAGFSAGEIRPEEADPSLRVGWIITLGVSPVYRRKGIANALLSATEKQLLKQADLLRLCVRVSNQSAIALYHHTGYTKLAIWSNYYPGGEDALLLGKKAITKEIPPD